MRKLWNKDFILLLQGSVVSSFGDLMYSVAIGYWVYEETGSSALMGIMSSISMFVTMFLSPFTGSVVDKCNRKFVLVCVDIVQSIAMLIIGLLAFLGELNVPAVLIVAFIAAFGSVFYSPASSTLMIDVIPRDDMVRGQSLFSGAMSLVNMAGTALSGVMVAFLGVPLIVVINGLSNLYSAVSELFIHVPKTVQQGESVSIMNVLRDSGVAIKTILSDKCLKLFVPCVLLINLLSAGPLTLTLPLCMEKGFTVDMYGYIMAVWMLAYFVCVVLLGIIKLSAKLRFWVMSLCFVGSVFFFACAFLTNSFILMCIWAFLASFTNAAGNTILNASLMLSLPEENRGSILGFIQSASVGGTGLSAVIYGLLGEVFPLYIVFTIGNLLSLVPTLYICFHRETKEFILNN